MTSDPLDRITGLLRGAVADPGDVDALPPDRDETIRRIGEAIRARAKARRRRRLLAMLAVAAGLAATVGTGVMVSRRTNDAAVGSVRDLGRVVVASEGVTVLRDGRAQSIGHGARLSEGTELRTSGSSEAQLAFDNGTQLTLGGAGRVRLVEQSQRKRFALESGSFFARVAKLGVDERFVVATPDAEVEVRGTAFRLTIVPGEARCGEGTPTRLEVSEGLVVVRHGGAEVQVPAGGRWPSCPPSPVAQQLQASPLTASADVAPQAPSGRSPLHPVAIPATPEASSRLSDSHELVPRGSRGLAEQNDLFDDAMRLKRTGNAAGAEASLERLMTSYPSGPLAETAAVERMRLIAARDRARGANAARDYLRRYPGGFARADAEAIAAGPP